MSLEPKRAYKIVLIGDPEVGKTSIRRRYMGKTFKGEYLKTIGADFAAQKVVIEGETVLLTIWDLAGQTIFHGMRSSFYQGCKSALVVFDVTNKNSLENVEKWVEEAITYTKSSLQEIYLIGNKVDLKDKRVVTREAIEEKADKIKKLTKFPVRVYETSALTGENIPDLFQDLSRRLIIGDDFGLEVEGEIRGKSGDSSASLGSKKLKNDGIQVSAEIIDTIDQIEFHLHRAEKLLDVLRKKIKK